MSMARSFDIAALMRRYTCSCRFQSLAVQPVFARLTLHYAGVPLRQHARLVPNRWRGHGIAHISNHKVDQVETETTPFARATGNGLDFNPVEQLYVGLFNIFPETAGI